MKVVNWFQFGVAVFALPLALAGCGGGDGSGDAVPPQGAAALKTWLADGSYKSWKCEPEKHAARMPSPHAYNRICSNSILSGTADKANFPKDSAAVKELWGMDGSKLIGYAVYIKLNDDSAGGANWYYYEDNPELKMDGPVADGVGTSGPPKDVCVGCHSAAGKDDAHLAAQGARDFVYTQVK